MDDLFGDDFNSSVPTTNSNITANAMELTPADGQLGDVVDGLQPLSADPAESFLSKEKVLGSVKCEKTEFIIRNNLVTLASTSVLLSQHSRAVNLVVSWVLTELLELMSQLLLEVLEVVF